MSGTTISAAIVLALVAITLWVFAGGKGDDQTTTAPAASAGNAACQTPSGSNCVGAAQGLVQQLNQQAAQQGNQSAP
jgi:hypothetical protein